MKVLIWVLCVFYCNKCGAEMIDRAKFCAKCGTQVKTEENI